jgi:hypothetical protein
MSSKLAEMINETDKVTAQPCEGLKANSPGNALGDQNCVHLQAYLQPLQGLAGSHLTRTLICWQ